MQRRPTFSLLLLTFLVLACVACPPAAASDTDKIVCLRWIGNQGCRVGHEDQECGKNGWHCKSTWGNDCICFEYGTGKSGWWFGLVSDWRSQAGSPLLPNTVTPFQIDPGPGSSFGVWDLEDDTPDSASAEMHANPGDMSGMFVVRLLNGPPDAIPVEIEMLQLSLVSFQVEGAPTGQNNFSISSAAPELGVYDSTTQTLDFNAPIECTLVNDMFPGGRLVSIRPRAIPGAMPGQFYFNLSATLWIEPPGDAPAAATGGEALRVWPNPSFDGARVDLRMASSGAVRVDLFDAAGRVVRELLRGEVPGGLRTLEWDGRDGSGREVAPGVYFVQMRCGSGGVARERMVVVR